MQLRFGYLFILFLPLIPLAGQDVQSGTSGLDVSATVSGEAIYANQLAAGQRNGTPEDAAFRAVVYPFLRLDEHWTVEGAIQSALIHISRKTSPRRDTASGPEYCEPTLATHDRGNPGRSVYMRVNCHRPSARSTCDMTTP
jgi:hypothetical protein